MIALTLHQPWASLIAAGVKRHETRPRQVMHRGTIAIHAGKTVVPPDDISPACRALCARVLGAGWWLRVPTGAVVCIAELVECHRTEHRIAAFGSAALTRDDYYAGDWSPGRWAYELVRVRALAVPVPARGFQGPWPWQPPIDLAERLLAEGERP